MNPFHAKILVLGLLVGCSAGDEGPSPRPLGKGNCAAFDELRQPFFGDTHVHTRLSLDANTQETRLSPRDAYAFARGETIGLQPYDDDGDALRSLTIDRPLDFVMLSDHAEYLGTVRVCEDPAREGYDDPRCQELRDSPANAFFALNAFLSFEESRTQYPDLCGSTAASCIDAGADVWAEVQQQAEAAYDRTTGCEFTTFIGYEWTASPDTKNLHRNVIFANDSVPDRATSYFDEPHVEGLWRQLRAHCMDLDAECDAFTIPHNSNLAEGRFFEDAMEDGQPLSPAYAQERHAMEPIIEIYQHKGDSECLPGGLIGDELCGFEKLPFNNLSATTLGLVSTPVPSDFVRSALGEGMRFEQRLGTNPFELGIIASTDTHIAAPGAISEDDFLGHGGAGQPNRTLPEAFPDGKYLSPGGLAGVWAEENSREALFESMRNRETFGTSGPRIVPRFFGGWGYSDDLCDSAEFARIGYQQGVPMGSVLPLYTDGDADAAPRFAIMAMQDAIGAPLQRIQVVKGWIEDGTHRTRVYDVAGDSNNGASVDLATCEPTGNGAAELCTVWEDPSFDPSQQAYYYARVIQNPTCRWTTHQCVEAAYDCDARARPIDEACCDPAIGLNVAVCADVDCADPDALPSDQAACCVAPIEPIIQERAWTSPIWYRP